MFITKCGGKCIPLVKGKYFNFFKTRNKKHALNLFDFIPFFFKNVFHKSNVDRSRTTRTRRGQREKQCYLGFK